MISEVFISSFCGALVGAYGFDLIFLKWSKINHKANLIIAICIATVFTVINILTR